MRRTLIASPSTGRTRRRAPSGRASCLGHRPEVVAEAAQQVGGVERRDPSHLLAGVQPGQVGDVVEQAVQGIDVVLQQAEKVFAALLRQVAEGEALGDVRTTPRLPRRSCAACCQSSARLRSSARMSSSAASRSRTAPAASRRSRRKYWAALSLAASLTNQARVRASLGLHLGCGRLVGEVAVELGHQAEVQRAPLARDLVQVVALLPALQAVRLGVAGLVGRRRRASAEPGAAASAAASPSSQGGSGRRAAPAAANRRSSGPDRRRSPRARRRAAPECGSGNEPPARCAARLCPHLPNRSLPGLVAPSDDCRRRALASGDRAHPRLPAPLPRLGGGDEGAAVMGADHAARRAPRRPAAAGPGRRASMAIALRWPKASRTKSIAAPSFDKRCSAVVREDHRDRIEQHRRRAGELPVGGQARAVRELRAADLGRDDLDAARRRRRAACFSAATSAAIGAVGDQDRDRSGPRACPSSCRSAAAPATAPCR